MEDERAYNFALYSKNAERVELCFFVEDDLQVPVYSLEFDFLKNKSGPIWHCRVSEDLLEGARFYGYKVGGPAPSKGYERHTYDFEKVLLDPYAQSVFFPPDFDRAAAISPGSNMGKAPLGVLGVECNHCRFDWKDSTSPRHESDLLVYEMHVRGFTQNPNSGVKKGNRGGFAGVIEKIPYLVDLGITAVELMPVFQFDPGEDNFWGYMPLNFFSPHHAYAKNEGSYRQSDDFKEMVREFHEAGIEVILDVVYNHTAEGDHRGPIYSFKGIDNSAYYILNKNSPIPYANYSGTGNTLHTRNRAVRQLIIDSLRYWVTEMHVDGFRFDLASIFDRNDDGSVSLEDPPIFGEILSHPELSDIRLIAEPWDAHGLFQLGRRFPGTMWMQWNAQYRDTIQRFVRGDEGMVADVMTRIYGSTDLFPDDLFNAMHAYQSINYVSSHDGFTLYDMVSYQYKNNWANGHGNTDGGVDYSWNCGWEGDADVPPKVTVLRKRQVKNFFCLLMLSNGTPMFRMGDEFLQTQHGNNNPYNQDNETTWLDWNLLDRNRDVWRFFRGMIAFRKAHRLLSRSRFWREDIRWHGTGRLPDFSRESQQLAFSLKGAKFDEQDLYVMINSAAEEVEFGIHDGAPGEWRIAVNTGESDPDDIPGPGKEFRVETSRLRVPDHSIVVMVRDPVR